jgi:solute carrier family 25 protein 34/35
MQSYSGTSTGAVGDQTHYKGMTDGLIKIFKKEGVKGLFRGVDAAIIRTGMGSSVQLPIYSFAKNFLVKENLVAPDSTLLHLLSSTCAGFGVGVVMNPSDVMLTRLYNQKGSNHYTGPIDCFAKIIKYEGFGALYKGFFAQILRIGPHTILTLTFMEQTMKIVQKVETGIFRFE